MNTTSYDRFNLSGYWMLWMILLVFAAAAHETDEKSARPALCPFDERSEERRVGKECRCRW